MHMWPIVSKRPAISRDATRCSAPITSVLLSSLPFQVRKMMVSIAAKSHHSLLCSTKTRIHQPTFLTRQFLQFPWITGCADDKADLRSPAMPPYQLSISGNLSIAIDYWSCHTPRWLAYLDNPEDSYRSRYWWRCNDQYIALRLHNACTTVHNPALPLWQIPIYLSKCQIGHRAQRAVTLSHSSVTNRQL